jgi:SCY1-like protein 2
VLDKYTMQEKIVPLIRAIKTKEPAVMLAALKVLEQIGTEADADFIAIDILPILWTMSLGPLLDLKQFQAFMELIKLLSSKVEQEHSRKLQELSGSSSGARNTDNSDFMSFGDSQAAFSSITATGGDEDDFERLVTGKYGSSKNYAIADGGWDASSNASVTHQPPATPTFSWSTTPPPAPTSPGMPSLAAAMRPQGSPRTITPDLSRFDSLQPSSTQFSQPLQPAHTSSFSQSLQAQTQAQPGQPSINWQAAATNSSGNIWAQSSPNPANSAFGAMMPLQPSQTTTNNAFSGMSHMTNSMSSLSMGQQQQQRNPPQPTQPSTPFSLPPPPSWSQTPQQPQISKPPDWNAFKAPQQAQQNAPSAFGGFQSPAVQPQKKGLDAYESLL